MILNDISGDSSEKLHCGNVPYIPTMQFTSAIYQCTHYQSTVYTLHPVGNVYTVALLHYVRKAYFKNPARNLVRPLKSFIQTHLCLGGAAALGAEGLTPPPPAVTDEDDGAGLRSCPMTCLMSPCISRRLTRGEPGTAADDPTLTTGLSPPAPVLLPAAVAVCL